MSSLSLRPGLEAVISAGRPFAARGAGAGFVGTAALVGVITTLRRWLLTSEQLAGAQTHPEKIAQRLADLAGRGTLDDRTRRRFGDVIHFGYGTMWGAILASMIRGRRVHVVAHGLTLGLGLWGFGFIILLPLLRAHRGPWTWNRREFVLTLSAHTTYGLVTAAALKLLQKR